MMETTFTSWGRYPRVRQWVESLMWADQFAEQCSGNTKVLAVGLGRSYGDVCLNEDNKVLITTALDRIHDFDIHTGVLRSEAGISLAQILRVVVPRGWFLPVVPGTKYVTLGGAVANDVHGKNHHLKGTFGCHVLQLELLRSDGTRLVCSPCENQNWFAATIAGMGLTGLITWVEIQLIPIKSRSIEMASTRFRGLPEFLELCQKYAERAYSVAWLDCVSRGRDARRGIFMAGHHSEEASSLHPTNEGQLTVPLDCPTWLLNRATMRVFNGAYYRRHIRKQRQEDVDLERFFFPLDGVRRWNRIYGRSGFLQFQCCLPFETVEVAMTKLLDLVSDSGLASFLAVLKAFGEVRSPGLMSFPRPGLTLTLDFPVGNKGTISLVDRLCAITSDFGGHLYPAKDARMTSAQFRRGYPAAEEFARYIDPRFSSSFWRRVAG